MLGFLITHHIYYTRTYVRLISAIFFPHVFGFRFFSRFFVFESTAENSNVKKLPVAGEKNEK